MTDTETIADVIATVVRAAIAPYEKRIAALEARPTPEHVGGWQDGKTYTSQQMVQHDGSCWFALRETSAKPGDSDAWRLVAKRGRDAR